MLRALKRILLLLLVLIAIGAGAFYVLYLHRTPLPPAPPHARAVPAITSLPGLSACWIETGKTFSRFPIGMTAGGILLRHPAGDLLIDTGNSSHLAQDVSIYPFWLRLKLQSLAGQLNPKVPLPDMRPLYNSTQSLTKLSTKAPTSTTTAPSWSFRYAGTRGEAWASS